MNIYIRIWTKNLLNHPDDFDIRKLQNVKRYVHLLGQKKIFLFCKQIIYYKSWFLSFVIIYCANFQNTPSDRKYPNTFQDTVNQKEDITQGNAHIIYGVSFQAIVEFITMNDWKTTLCRKFLWEVPLKRPSEWRGEWGELYI